jgi:ferredoxin--NADP+ reductase
MTNPGTPAQPLRIAIIGAGPSGFYAAEHLLKQTDIAVQVDMFERLPSPYGLVRGGVAPDHPKIKKVTRVYDKIAEHPSFRYFGHVEYGTDLTHDDLTSHYHAIIYAVGTQSDRKLDIPGEDLPGSHGATEFVAWYNAHPDYAHLQFDLSQEAAAVVGIGNVAMDVARILGRSQAELHATDIADYALEALAHSNIKTIYILGRRGAAQAKFTNPEVKEMGEMEEADVIVDPAEVDLDPLSQAILDSGEDKTAVRNVEVLRQYSRKPPSGKPRQIIFRFLVSPVEIIGADRVEAIRIVKNELVDDGRGDLRPQPTGDYEILPVGLVFRSVGYLGTPLPDVPFYERWGTIPNDRGRVMTAVKDGEQVTGEYVVGWIKRGPSGVIGTNKPCAVETIEALLEDLAAGRLLRPAWPSVGMVEELLKGRGIRYITFEDWQIIDQLEIIRGEAAGRPRLKFSDVYDMLDTLESYKSAQPTGD